MLHFAVVQRGEHIAVKLNSASTGIIVFGMKRWCAVFFGLTALSDLNQPFEIAEIDNLKIILVVGNTRD